MSEEIKGVIPFSTSGFIGKCKLRKNRIDLTVTDEELIESNHGR
jgi:hypothetical protein